MHPELRTIAYLWKESQLAARDVRIQIGRHGVQYLADVGLPENTKGGFFSRLYEILDVMGMSHYGGNRMALYYMLSASVVIDGLGITKDRLGDLSWCHVRELGKFAVRRDVTFTVIPNVADELFSNIDAAVTTGMNTRKFRERLSSLRWREDVAVGAASSRGKPRRDKRSRDHEDRDVFVWRRLKELSREATPKDLAEMIWNVLVENPQADDVIRRISTKRKPLTLSC